MVTYPLGDFLIQIKNAKLAGKKEISLPSSKLISAVAKVLKKEGILDKVEAKEGVLSATLAYHKKEPVVMDVKLVSRPGLRRYAGVDDIKSRKRRNASFLVLSTPLGILSSKEAIKKNTGGEVIAEIW